MTITLNYDFSEAERELTADVIDKIMFGLTIKRDVPVTERMALLLIGRGVSVMQPNYVDNHHYMCAIAANMLLAIAIDFGLERLRNYLEAFKNGN